MAKGEGKEAAAGCKLRLVGCRLAAGGMEGPSHGGCRQWAQGLEPVAAWLQPAEQSVPQVGSKEDPGKTQKLFVCVANIQKRVNLCYVISKSFPKLCEYLRLGFFPFPFLTHLHSA